MKRKIFGFSFLAVFFSFCCLSALFADDEVYYRYIPNESAYKGYENIEMAYEYFPESELEERKNTGYRIEKVPGYKPKNAVSSVPAVETKAVAVAASAVNNDENSDAADVKKQASADTVKQSRKNDSQIAGGASVIESVRNNKYQDSLDLEKQPYVGAVKLSRINDLQWVDNCLDLDMDAEKFGVKIAAYRIQWPGGQWSGWFVPGVNDLYNKDSEPIRRYWACFNDHNFEIIYISAAKVNWQERGFIAEAEK